MVHIADLADSGAAFEIDEPYFAGWHFNMRYRPFFGHDLRSSSCGAYDLAPSAPCHLDIVNKGALRDIAQKQAVACLYLSVF